MAPAFAIFLLLTFLVPAGLLSGIYAVVVLTLILGIKDLVIVNRRAAYQLLTFLLSFAGCFLLFDNFSSWSLPIAFISLAVLAALWLWVVDNLPDRKAESILPIALAALLLFEIGAIIFLLPLSFFSQAALLFFASALLFEAATDLASLTVRQVSLWAGSYAAMAVLVVLLANWKV